MDAQKIYYIAGAVFFILASVLAATMIYMMFGGGLLGLGD
jgi:hypothetical protein